jgi:hypothetical protein
LFVTSAGQFVSSGINADPFCLSQVQQKVRNKTKGGEITQPLMLECHCLTYAGHLCVQKLGINADPMF